MTKSEFKALREGVLTEAQIERACTEWLALDGWTALVTDPKQLRGLGVSEPGIPDKQYRRSAFGDRVYGAHAADLMWIEWKRVSKSGRTTRTSERQDAWHAAERARGFLTLRAGIDFPATIEGFQTWYRASGLMRRKI